MHVMSFAPQPSHFLRAHPSRLDPRVIPMPSHDQRTSTQLWAKRGKKGKGGGRGGGGGGGGGGVPSGRIVPTTEYISVNANGDDAWKTMDVVDIINRGGLGILPTDTGYGLVTTLDSKNGLERLLRLKQQFTTQKQGSNKKPLSVLCPNLSTIDEYCYGIDRSVFKILKKNLPGPYTFILPASTSLPKGMILTSGGGKQSWARSTVGIRMPKDPVLRYLQDELLNGTPLLVSSIPKQLIAGQGSDDDEYEDDDGYYGVDDGDNGDDNDDDGISPFAQCSLDPEASWCNQLDFIVDAGMRPLDGSTIYDLTARGEPELIREGIGESMLLV